MRFMKLSIYALTAALMTAPTVGLAWHWDDDDDDEEPFDEAFLFFELNDTDGDLGIHGKIDGDEWKYLEIEDPRDRKMLNVWVRGRLKKQGLTELFFESAEPCFPETCEDGEEGLEPDEFFARFPEGEYDIEGYTLDGEERESEVILSQIIPAAPGLVKINGDAVGDECIEDVVRPVILSWDATEISHPDLDMGRVGPVQIRYYEVVVEIDESDFKSTSMIPRVPVAGRASWTIPDDFFVVTAGIAPDNEYKFEILARTNVYDEDDELVMIEVEIDGVDVEVPVPGNKTAMESCFVLM